MSFVSLGARIKETKLKEQFTQMWGTQNSSIEDKFSLFELINRKFDIFLTWCCVKLFSWL